MNLAQQNGARELTGDGWIATVLDRPPLIAPARQFTFPFAVAGEEDALARGALWLQVRSTGGTWLAQCALGFAGTGVAHGLWPLAGGGLLACAGGYAYAIDPDAPERTVLLPPRPAVAVIALAERTVLVTHHALAVREADGEVWATPRLSWEGVTVTGADEAAVRGLGWNMMDDVEIAFEVDLRRRTATGGGYRLSGDCSASV
ncbi:hypothetical protein [Terriglobus aquaticus]|uniref:hypothetical protein n=1 Tax=Terriglobus aquaticus TaxID=940139 RepID=UPI0021DFFBEF|nr:hypothetical protein [Terriglobus aquaticus]